MEAIQPYINVSSEFNSVSQEEIFPYLLNLAIRMIQAYIGHVSQMFQ